MVVVNLYPFYDKVTSTGGIAFDDGIENIDIGGPAMIRAAAKVIVDELAVKSYLISVFIDPSCILVGIIVLWLCVLIDNLKCKHV